MPKMNQEKQKIYSVEFRASAVKLANESDQPIAQTGKDLGINVNMLHPWIKQQSNDFSVDVMCRSLKVSRSAYDAWLQRGQTEEAGKEMPL